MKNRILSLLRLGSCRPANVPELLRGLIRPRNQPQRLQESPPQKLKPESRIARVKGKDSQLIPGRIQITRNGRGFVRPDDPGIEEIAIPAAATGTAFHDDQVLVQLDGRPGPASGAVVRVIQRRRKQMVGTLKADRDRLHVVPDDPRMPRFFSVRPPRDTGRPARPGDKVVVTLLPWDSPRSRPQAEIIEVLGPATAEGVDMLGVIRQYDLPLKFPPEVLREARSCGTTVSNREREGRVDCRNHPVITIDPADAKDFDDAFSLEPAAGNRWKLRVHIADVSHYVKPGTALDAEARKRGNSTYLVDRVIPMLPEALSNELCSLKPRVDRLTKCVEFLIADDGKVLDSRCYPAVIHSRRRFTYEEAMRTLENQPGDDIETMLHQAWRLAEQIRRLRFRNGSLDFDFPESKIWLDGRGRVERIERCTNDASHQLIEEFMLLANEAVAKRLKKMKRPAIHRVHEAPDPRRLGNYRNEVLRHNVPCGNLEKPVQVQKLLLRLGELAIGPALKIGFLKALTRARYSVDPAGHYGLAKADYTHFTSPIRRYADLVVHRSLFAKEEGDAGHLRETANHISATERNAADAERDSRAIKLEAYLQEQIQSGKRQRYGALVTDIRDFGFFVDVTDLGFGGLVPFSMLEEDHFQLEASSGVIRGRRHGRIIRLGDRIEVEVARVDPSKRQVDFQFPSENRSHPSTTRQRGKRPSRRKSPRASRNSARTGGFAKP